MPRGVRAGAKLSGVSEVEATRAGSVAVVTGASRGAGRGIAKVLGEHGATVYVTARTTRKTHSIDEFPHSIEETAAEVDLAGGHGIAVRCDHTNDAEVASLFAQVSAEQSRLDILVCNAWGGYMPYVEHNDWWAKPFWEQSMDRWDGMFTSGLRAHMTTCLHGIPMMVAGGSGALSSPRSREDAGTSVTSFMTSRRMPCAGWRQGSRRISVIARSR